MVKSVESSPESRDADNMICMITGKLGQFPGLVSVDDRLHDSPPISRDNLPTICPAFMLNCILGDSFLD